MILSYRKEEVEALLDKIQLRLRDYLRECALLGHAQVGSVNTSQTTLAGVIP
jgi:hypothetical protein